MNKYNMDLLEAVVDQFESEGRCNPKQRNRFQNLTKFRTQQNQFRVSICFEIEDSYLPFLHKISKYLENWESSSGKWKCAVIQYQVNFDVFSILLLLVVNEEEQLARWPNGHIFHPNKVQTKSR